MNKKIKKRQVYPYYGLKDCVAFVGKLKTKHGFAEVPKNTALIVMGFNDPQKSIAYRASSAITAFGLLEERGAGENKSYRFTDLGKQTVLLNDGTSEKISALQEAALNYAIIKDLCDTKFSNNLPGDDVIKTELVVRGFTERAAARFVLTLRETYDYAQLGNKYSPQRKPDFENGIGGDKSSKSEENNFPLVTKTPGYIISRLGLAGEKEVLIQTPIGMSNKEFDFMILWMKQLELVTDTPDNNGQNTFNKEENNGEVEQENHNDEEIPF